MFTTPPGVMFRVGDGFLHLAKNQSPVIEGAEKVETYWEVEDIPGPRRICLAEKAIHLFCFVHGAV